MIVPFIVLALATTSFAHTAAWAPGMYCRNGTSGGDDNNTNDAVNPLYNLTKADWWFQHDRLCDTFPPLPGDFLNLPAGGSVTVELAHNRAQTTLSYDGQFMSDWPDGQDHPDDWNAADEGTECLSDGAMHASNQSTAWGTAFAISYESELSAVTMENLVVFTTLEHTPWKRIATYDVPAALPACGPEGCTCAWLWVPFHCGQPNMYMQGFKCNVTGATSTIPVAPAKAPVYCADGVTPCVTGAKQMLVFNQLEGNNVVEHTYDDSPGYNSNFGWATGAQNDIFESSEVAPPSSTSTLSSSTSSLPAVPTTLITSAAPVTQAATSTTSNPVTTSKISHHNPHHHHF